MYPILAFEQLSLTVKSLVIKVGLIIDRYRVLRHELLKNKHSVLINIQNTLCY